MSILSRYLLRQHAAPFAFALGTLTGLMLLNQIVKQFGNLVGKGLPAGVIIEVFVLSIPFIIAMTLPMAVLVAVLYAFSQLGAENEITAMKASGLSLVRLVRPVLIAGAGLAVVAFLWSDQVLPRTNHVLRMLLTNIQRKKPTFTLREQVINEVQPGRFFLRAARIDPATNKLRDVTIYDLQDATRQRTIIADSGRMAYTPGGTDLYLTLLDGSIQEVEKTTPDQLNRTFFRTQVIRVRDVSNVLERTIEDNYRSDREMSTCQMDSVIRAAQADGRRARIGARLAILNELRNTIGLSPAPEPPDAGAVAPPNWYCRLQQRWPGAAALVAGPPPAAAVPAAAPAPAFSPASSATASVSGARQATLPFYLSQMQQVRQSRQLAAQYQVELHKKYTIAVAAVVFVLVGIPVALRFPRGGVGLVIGASMVVFGVYYMGLIGGEELGDRLIVSPVWVMWAPNVLFGAGGLAGLWLVRRGTVTTRGGDWGEIQERLERWFWWLGGLNVVRELGWLNPLDLVETD